MKFLDQSIQQIFNLILKKEALHTIGPLSTIWKHALEPVITNSKESVPSFFSLSICWSRIRKSHHIVSMLRDFRKCLKVVSALISTSCTVPYESYFDRVKRHDRLFCFQNQMTYSCDALLQKVPACIMRMHFGGTWSIYPGFLIHREPYDWWRFKQNRSLCGLFVIEGSPDQTWYREKN